MEDDGPGIGVVFGGAEMATRNQTALFRKYRQALRSVRPFAGASSRHGGAIELVEAPLLKGGPRGYNAVVGEDLDADRLRCVLLVVFCGSETLRVVGNYS